MAETEIKLINNRTLCDTTAREEISKLKEDIANGSGLNSSAKDLLITILRNGLYTVDQSENITKLETALASGSSGDNSGGDSGEDEPSTPTVTKYTITNLFTNVTSNNSKTSIEEKTSYSATLTPNEGYMINSILVFMGGVDITSSVVANGVITIPSVTANVEITAIAIEEQKEVALNTNGLQFDFDFRNVTMEAYNLSGWGNVKRTVDKTNKALLFGTSDASGDGIGIKYGFRDNRIVSDETKNFELGTSYTVQAMYKTADQKAQPNIFNWASNVVSPNKYKIDPKYKNSANELKTVNVGEIDYANTNEPYIVATYIVEGSNLKVYFNDYLMFELNGGDYEGFTKWQDYGCPNEIYNDDYVVSFVGYNRALTNTEMIDNLAYFETLEVVA